MTETAENQTIEIPDRYKRLGVKIGYAHTPASKLRMIFEGLPGHGKSQFLMSIPDLLVLDADNAANNAVTPRAARVPIRNYGDYEVIRDALIEDKKNGRSAFARVGFDTIDAFLRVLDEHLCDQITTRKLNTILEFGEKGAGYAKLGAALIRELRKFDAAGIPWVIASHMLVKRTVLSDNTVLTERRCAMAPTIMRMIFPYADVKARMFREVTREPVVTTKKFTGADGKEKTVETRDGGKETATVHHWLGLLPDGPKESEEALKRRIPPVKLGDDGMITVPLTDGWAVFEAEYEKCASAWYADQKSQP